MEIDDSPTDLPNGSDHRSIAGASSHNEASLRKRIPIRAPSQMSLTSRQYDLDGDGKLDPVEQKLRDMHDDGTGLNPYRVQKVIQEKEQTLLDLKLMRRVAKFVSLVAVLLLVCNFALSFVTVLVVKDMKSSNQELVDVESGEILATRPKILVVGLADQTIEKERRLFGIGAPCVEDDFDMVTFAGSIAHDVCTNMLSAAMFSFETTDGTTTETKTYTVGTKYDTDISSDDDNDCHIHTLITTTQEGTVFWYLRKCGVSGACEFHVSSTMEELPVCLEPYQVRDPIDLGTAANFAILTKAGVTTTAGTSVTGDIGTSPIASTAITGFGLILDSSTTYSTSPSVTGKVYAASYTSPTPSNLGTAISNMETAYTAAAGKVTPLKINYMAGLIEGQTLFPGLYKWGTSVSFTSKLTFHGSDTHVWILQIAQDVVVGSGANIVLSGGALAENIFWQVAGSTTFGTTSHVEGIFLGMTQIVFETGSSLNGRALSQTAVTLDAATINERPVGVRRRLRGMRS